MITKILHFLSGLDFQVPNLVLIMNEYFGDQYCPFCDNETDMTLKEHGKTCPDYQETVSQNICPFCASQIDECYIEQHDKYRYFLNNF